MRFGIQATVFCAYDEVMAARGHEVEPCEESTFAPILFKSTSTSIAIAPQPVKDWTMHPEGLVCPHCEELLRHSNGRGLSA